MKDLSKSARKQRYILLYGLAIYGAALFISCQIWAFCLSSDHLNGRWLVYWLIVSILINASAGLLVGWLQWLWSEHRALRISRER